MSFFDVFISCCALVDVIVHACVLMCASGTARGKQDVFYFKLIQAWSFLRFKQFRFRESIAYFEEQIEIMGPCSALLENIGHAYNRFASLSSCHFRRHVSSFLFSACFCTLLVFVLFFPHPHCSGRSRHLTFLARTFWPLYHHHFSSPQS